MKLVIGICLVVVGTVFPAHEAKADISSDCLVHLAGLHDGTTAAEDVRYHTRKGEFSPCTEQEAAEADRGTTRFEETSRDESDGYEKKSRYCRKRWFC